MISPEVLRRYPCFAGASEATLKQVAIESEQRSYAPRETLIVEGEPAETLFVITEGEVDIVYTLADGVQRTVDTLVAGDLLCWSAVIPPHTATATAVAKRETHAIAISGVALRRLCREDHDFGVGLLEHITAVVSRRLNDARVQLAAVHA